MLYIYDGTNWIPLVLGDATPPGDGIISGLTAAAGVGTITLSWSESGDIDSVNIYRDAVLVDTIDPGIETWDSVPTEDGLYTWSVVPVTGGSPGVGDDIEYGVMTADIYVDAENGSDSNNGTTPALAVATLNKAGSLISGPGIKVAIRGGTYSEYNVRASSATYGGTVTTFDTSGTPEAPIIISSFPGEDVIIDGSSITRPITGGTDAHRPELFTILGDYYIFTGTEEHPIVLRNSAGCGLRNYFNNGLKVYYVHSYHHEGSAFNMQNSFNWEIAYCAGWDTYSTVNDGESSDGVSGANSRYAIVRDSFFGWNGDDGVDFIVGTDNTVYNCVAYKNGYFMNGMAGQGNGNGFKMSGSTNNNPSRNVFYNNIAAFNRYIGFTLNGGSAWAESNTAIGNSDFGFAIGNGTPGENIVLRHNVAYDNGVDNTDDMLYNGVTPGVDEYNSWNIDNTPQSSDFITTTASDDWLSWEEFVSAQFGALHPEGSYKGKGEDGADIGWEGPEPIIPIPDSGSQTIFVGGRRDDGYITGTSFNYTSSNFQGSTYRAFWRFKLPPGLLPGATIESASLELYNRDSSASAEVKLYAHADDNSTVPYNATTANAQLSNLTTANVTWSLSSSTNGTQALSPDISAIIQEIVDRPGFQAGNYVMLWSVPQSGAQKRFYTQEWNNTNYMPRLNIEWTNPVE